MRHSPMEETRSGRPSSHAPIRAERSTLDGHTLPLGRNKTVGDRLNLPLNRNKTIRPWDRPLNRETLNDRPTLLTPPQRIHHETDGAEASATTMRKPMLRARTARVVERTRERNTVAETHFQSDLSG